MILGLNLFEIRNSKLEIAPLRARLFASVAEEVKTTSLNLAPIKLAKVSRDLSNAAIASWPKE